MKAGAVLLVVATLAACFGDTPTPAEVEQEPAEVFINLSGTFWMISPGFAVTARGDRFRYRYVEYPWSNSDFTDYRSSGPIEVELLDAVASPRGWDTAGRESMRASGDCSGIIVSNHAFYRETTTAWVATEDSIWFDWTAVCSQGDLACRSDSRLLRGSWTRTAGAISGFILRQSFVSGDTVDVLYMAESRLPVSPPW